MTGFVMPALGAAAFAGASARWNWWRPKTKGLGTLMYHKIGRYPPGSKLKSLWVTPEEFRWQMEYLKRYEYTPLLFRDLIEIQAGRRTAPEKPVLVTFDDGYANNFEEAFPILHDLGIKANFFLVYETLDHHNAWHDPANEPWIRMLAWNQVFEMQKSGLADFGSHTMRHRHLPSIPLDDARWEIFESRQRLEDKLGQKIVAFAYPYGSGAYVPAIRAAVREAGYAFDFGVRQGYSPWPWNPDSGPLKRLFIRGDDNRFDFHLHMTRGKSRF